MLLFPFLLFKSCKHVHPPPLPPLLHGGDSNHGRVNAPTRPRLSVNSIAVMTHTVLEKLTSAVTSAVLLHSSDEALLAGMY